MRIGGTALILITATALVAGIRPAAAANRDAEWKACNGSPGTSLTDQIAACTARIKSGDESPNQLFVAWYNRALTKYRMEQYQGAADDYAGALAIKPSDAEAWSGRGLADFHLNRFADAVSDFSHALEIDPRNADTLYQRGTANAALKKWDDAIADLDKAISLKHDFAEAL